MKPLPEDEEALYRQAMAELQEETQAEALAEADVAALITDDVQGEQRLDLIEQMLKNPESRRDFQNAVALEDAMAEEVEDQAPVVIRSRRVQLYALAGLAAAMLLVIGGLFYLEPAPPKPILRGGNPQAIALEPAPNQSLPAFPERFTWRGDSIQGMVRLKVLTESGDTVFNAEITRFSSIPVPPEVREQQTPGVYYWSIEASGSNGVTRWGPYRFTVSET